MSWRYWLLGVAVLLVAGGVQAQTGRSPQTPEDFIAILKPASPAAPVMRTRSLAPSTGAIAATEAARPPGTAGSGNLPDLNIRFAFNSAELTPEARQRLDKLGAALASNELLPFSFQIAGHTDTVGSPDYNFALSRSRADAVVNYLVERWGIDPERLRPRGYGMTQLFDPDGTSPLNRRVEVQTLAVQ